MNRTLTLSDGRTLEWTDNGIDASEVIILHAGTTVGLDVWNSWLKAAGEQGVHAISLNRAGVGQSTRNPGRRMQDDANDVQQLVNQLGITKFVSVGWSGGGGRALGTTFIPECVAAHTIACIPWQDPEDALWMATVTPERLELTTACRASFEELLRRRGSNVEQERNVTAQEMLESFPTFLPHFSQFEDEYRQFANDFSAGIRQALLHGALADGDDYAANIHLWGFQLEDIKKPVTLWHGEVDDDVEVIYGEYNKSRIPGSKLVRLKELGHIDIIIEARDQILAAAIQSLKAADIDWP